MLSIPWTVSRIANRKQTVELFGTHYEERKFGKFNTHMACWKQKKTANNLLNQFEQINVRSATNTKSEFLLRSRRKFGES